MQQTEQLQKSIPLDFHISLLYMQVLFGWVILIWILLDCFSSSNRYSGALCCQTEDYEICKGYLTTEGPNAS